MNTAELEELSELYSSLRLALKYNHAEQKLDVEVDPLADRVVKSRVRGRTRTLTTRLDLDTNAPHRTP